MAVKDKIRMHVEKLFLDAPKSHRAIELKEELIANLNDRYDDLIVQGKDEELAYDVVISGIGDIDELVRGLQDKYIYDPDSADRQRKKSALLVSIAVGMYILGIVPAILYSQFHMETIGFVFMFLIWAIATTLIVYSAMSRPRYKKDQESIVEDFKEWSRSSKKTKALRNSISSIVWMTATIIFLAGGMLFNLFHILWLVFLLAVVVNIIVNLVFSFIEADK